MRKILLNFVIDAEELEKFKEALKLLPEKTTVSAELRRLIRKRIREITE